MGYFTANIEVVVKLKDHLSSKDEFHLDDFLEQLLILRQLHYEKRANEYADGRRLEINPNNTQSMLLGLNSVDVCIPATPSSVLIESVSFTLSPSSFLIITGASGCGKSSFVRLLAGLQYNQTKNSRIQTPARHSMVFIPQQVYLIEGTLREQLNYFRYARNMPGYTDDQEIEELLYKFNLSHLIDQYTLDLSEQSWSRILSLGEQQRLIIVVALLTLVNTSHEFNRENQPVKYFILDETTANCDELTEKTIYEHLQHSHVQYISISHRHQLIKYHTHQLLVEPENQSYQFVELT